MQIFGAAGEVKPKTIGLAFAFPTRKICLAIYALLRKRAILKP